MSHHEPKADLLGDYPNASALDWSEFVKLLPNANSTRWLATVNGQGQVHTTPIGAFFVNETFYFTSGQGTRKRANLAQNPNCSIGLHTAGYDIVAEGTAAITRDEATIQRFAAYCQSVDWPVKVKGVVLDAPYHAPTTGPAPYDVYEMTLRKVFAYDTNNEGVNHSTRFTF